MDKWLTRVELGLGTGWGERVKWRKAALAGRRGALPRCAALRCPAARCRRRPGERRCAVAEVRLLPFTSFAAWTHVAVGATSARWRDFVFSIFSGSMPFVCIDSRSKLDQGSSPYESKSSECFSAGKVICFRMF